MLSKPLNHGNIPCTQFSAVRVFNEIPVDVDIHFHKLKRVDRPRMHSREWQVGHSMIAGNNEVQLMEARDRVTIYGSLGRHAFAIW